MKRTNSVIQNVEFLLSMYKRELKYYEEGNEEISDELKEAYENIIIELEIIIEFSKGEK